MSNLLKDASILLTPTAYDNGSMNAIKPESGDGDFDFQRNSAATRVNAQGLVENVQIISSELVSNGNFSQIGTEEVLNGNFSQEGSELVTNGDFSNGLTDWSFVGDGSISNGELILPCCIFNNRVSQSIGMSSSKSYKLEINITEITSGDTIDFLQGGAWTAFGTQLGINTVYITNPSDSDLYLRNNNGTSIIKIDNVSVKEVGQDWTLGTGWSIGDGEAVFDGGSDSNLVSASNVVNGKSYKYSFTISNMTNGALSFRLGSSSANDLRVTTDGTYTGYALSDGTGIRFRAESGFEGSITNISVKEVGQDWSNFNGCEIGENKVIYDGSLPTADCRNVFIAPSNKNYKVTYTVEDYVQGTHKVRISNYTSDETGNGTFTDVINSGSGGIVRLYGTSSFIGSFTNISVKEITDDTNLPRINYEGFSYQDSLGSEEVVNGDFATNSNWNFANADFSVGSVLFDDDNDNIFQNWTDTVNTTYKLTITKTGSGTLRFRSGYSGSAATKIDIPESGIIYFTSTSDTNRIQIYGDIGSVNTTLNSISIKEYLGQEVVPDSGCGSWLLEPQSTNLITYSEDFSQSGWTSQEVTLSSNVVVSPDGTQNASELTISGGTPWLGNNASLTAGNTYTVSCFVKKGTNRWVRLSNVSSSTTGAWFDLENNVLGSRAPSSLSSSIKGYGNDWYKITNTFIAQSGSNTFLGLSDTDGSTASTGVGKTIYVWGFQVEEQSYATSYIPTNGATNTRLQDIANNSGNSSLINSTEGVLYAEINLIYNQSGRYITLGDGTSNNRIIIGAEGGNNRIIFYVIVGGNVQCQIPYILSDINAFYKIAIKYKQNDFALWVNGIEVGTDTSGSTLASNTLSKLVFNGGTGTSIFQGKTKALAVYKEALTDAELQALTTI